MTSLELKRALTTALLVSALAALTACTDDRAPDDTGAIDAALGSDAALDGSDSSLEGDADAEVEPFETTQDRCNGARCLPSRLPPQPELEFLEPMGEGWLRLMEADWAVAPSAEGYRCMTFTVPEDVLITAFAPQSPPGTHHSTFGVSETATGPDEVIGCSVGQTGERGLQGSGAGSTPSQLPPGIAMRLRAGEQISMNLHLFNTSEEPLRGRSGMWIKTIPESELQAESETVLAGPLSLFVPVGRSTQRGRCTLRADATLYSLGPHMHQKGVHMRVTASMNNTEVELYDGDYDFNHKLVHEIEAIELEAGDVVHVECTYRTTPTADAGRSSLTRCASLIGLSPRSIRLIAVLD